MEVHQNLTVDKELKIEFPYDRKFHYWIYKQINWNQYVEEMSALAYALQQYSKSLWYEKIDLSTNTWMNKWW